MKKNLSVFQRTSLFCSSIPFVAFGLLAVFYAPFVSAQDTNIFKCPETEYPFVGTPEKTLCQQNQNFTCAIQIGQGTPLTKSSLVGASITGNVCIVGNFEIDASFTFQNATVRVNPGVTISIAGSPNSYDGGRALNIDNSKFFACSGLWKGITMGFASSIATYNNSQIEDAEIAIFTNTLSGLSIQHTVFNRNKVGIQLETIFPNPSAPGPLLWVFAGNRFSCDAPLNGTTDEISLAGVKLINSPLFSFQSELNRFLDLQYGIYASGSASYIGAKDLYMQRIRKDGIHMIEGALSLKDSYFYDYKENGINMQSVKIATIENCQFLLTSAIPDNMLHRAGIFMEKVLLNADIKISSMRFGADMTGTSNKVRGIHIKGGDIGAGAKIHIGSENNFYFRGMDSQGIYLEGIFPPTCTTEIWNNHFRVSNIVGGTGLRPSGIESYGGDKNNLSIRANTFTSYYFNPEPAIGIYQFNHGIWLRDNTLGTNNVLDLNGFNDDIQTMYDGIIVDNFQNTKYCSNVFKGSGYSYGIEFNLTCTGTDFVGNIFNFAGYDCLLINNNSQIGTQVRKLNEWNNLYGFEPANHARCTGDPADSKFIVHTQQSTCADENDPCFSKYHPRKITPDVSNEFFSIQNGPLAQVCDALLVGEGTDELDRKIAKGLFVSPSGHPAMGWILERYLYHKLKNNPAFISEDASFPTFINAKQYASVGKFYDVYKGVQNALAADAIINIKSRQTIDGINMLIDSIIEIDSAIVKGAAALKSLISIKQNLITQIQNLNANYDGMNIAYKNQVSLNLQGPYNLNAGISPQQAYEVNEKAVNQIYILSLMQQNGQLTESQVLALQSIALLDPKQNGPAVQVAMGLLPTCIKSKIYNALISPEKAPGQLDFSEDRSDPISKNLSNKITVSPNPTSSVFLIRNPSGEAGTLSLIDVNGKVIMLQKISGVEILLNMEPDTPSGIYLLSMLMDDGTYHMEKVIFQPR